MEIYLLLTSEASLSHKPVCHSINLSTLSFDKSPLVPSNILGSTEIVLVLIDDRANWGEEAWNFDLLETVTVAVGRVVRIATRDV